jgi:hypothetical protein
LEGYLPPNFVKNFKKKGGNYMGGLYDSNLFDYAKRSLEEEERSIIEDIKFYLNIKNSDLKIFDSKDGRNVYTIFGSDEYLQKFVFPKGFQLCLVLSEDKQNYIYSIIYKYNITREYTISIILCYLKFQKKCLKISLR